MKISIITPSYNQAPYLEQTIRSVLGQGFPDLEYWIVDGGSTDGSLEIIQKYADILSGWVSEPDNGQADAINKGFRQVTGEIVSWLNSDDVYPPGVLKEVAGFFHENPDIGMVYGNAVSFDQDGYPMNDLVFSDWGLEGLVSFNIICQPAVFMRKTVLEAAGYLDEEYHMLLDHHLWLRIAQITQITHMPKVWAFARHHSGAKNVAQAPRFGQEAYKVLAWMKTQPALLDIIQQNSNTVNAMVHRFNGRYLLDGGQGWPALKSYIRSMAADPGIALQEWHRILFAALTVIGLGRLGAVYYKVKKTRLPASLSALDIQNVNQLYLDYHPYGSNV